MQHHWRLGAFHIFRFQPAFRYQLVCRFDFRAFKQTLVTTAIGAVFGILNYARIHASAP